MKKTKRNVTKDSSASGGMAGYTSQFPVFSGPYSSDMWQAINGAKTTADLRDALYFVCCRIQELETYIEKYIH